MVGGAEDVGGLVGYNTSERGGRDTWRSGRVSQCYSAGSVRGKDPVGGLIGYIDYHSEVTGSFWDTETSGQAESAGGTGKTTAEMQTAKTFLDAGWDFVGETKNGTEDIWTICEGRGYPRLAWERATCGDANQPARTVRYPDYVLLAKYGTRTFQWTYGRSGEWISEVVGTRTVTYGDGTRLTATEMTNTSFSQGRFWSEASYNDGVTTGMVAVGDYWLSSDPYLTSYPRQWSFGTVTEGMRVDMCPYYLIKMDGTQPPARMEYKVNLYTIQGVNVLCGHYADALILWSLDTRYSYVPLNFFGRDADLGVVLPTASDTAGRAITSFRIRGLHVGVIALGTVDPQRGQLEYLGELRRIEAP